MRMLLGCATALLLAATGARADELDRETKGKPATAPVAVKPATVAGSELDKESPEQSRHYHYRGGYGYGGGFGVGYGGYRSFGYGVGYSSFYRPSYGIGVYSSYYPAYYPAYSYPAYYGGFGYGSYYRPYGWSAGVSFRF